MLRALATISTVIFLLYIPLVGAFLIYDFAPTWLFLAVSILVTLSPAKLRNRLKSKYIPLEGLLLALPLFALFWAITATVLSVGGGAVEVGASLMYLLTFWLFQVVGPILKVPDISNKEQLRDVAVQDFEGNRVEIEEIFTTPSIVAFIRGDWCSYCKLQVEELFAAAEEFAKRGLQIIIISPQKHENLIAWERTYGPKLKFFSDNNLALANHFNIVHQGGTVLPVRNKNGADTIYPTVMITDGNKKVLHFFQTDNYTQRPKIDHILDIFDNHTMKHVLKDKIDAMTVDLEESLQQKRQLLRMVVHDIANPLSVIKANVDMARYGDQSDAKKLIRHLEKIEKAVKAQVEVVNSARELEALESGKLKVQLASVDLKQVIDDSLFLFEERIKQKNINLKIVGSFDIQVLAEQKALKNQVLANLISNAIKFTPNGGTIEIAADKLGQDAIKIQIKDSGIGMPPDLMMKIFDMGKSTSRIGTNGEKGTGFGLPLVKAYMDAFGAKIGVDSKTVDEFPIDHGTTFGLEFMLA